MKIWKYKSVIMATLALVALSVFYQERQILLRYTFDRKSVTKEDTGFERVVRNEEISPSVVTYFWCGNESRRFEFGHYLSMFSVIRALHPDVVYFTYEQYPSVDPLKYYVWLDEIRKQYPFVYLIKLERQQVCRGNEDQRLAARMSELSKRGGIYVHENTIVTQRVADILDKKQVIAVDHSTGHGFLMTQKGMPFRENVSEKLSCSSSADLSDEKNSHCVNTIGRLYPKDIWELDNDFGRLARWAAYGETSVQRPQPDYRQLAPNIAHYVWIGKSRMDFTMYLSMLSVLYAAKVDRVFIHGSAPIGPYWDKIRNNSKITVIPRQKETYVFGQNVSVLAHKSDVWRVDILHQYGGLYLDRDVIFVKPLSDRLRAYDAVISVDFITKPPFPDRFQNGIMLGKKGSQFWVEYMNTMRIYRDDLWAWNSCERPYKVKEMFPKSVFIYERLQVNCPLAKCHPTWWPNHYNKNVHHLNSKSLPDWRNDAYGYHFAGHGAPPELRNEKKARTSQTIFGEMARYVLDKAHLLKP